MSRISAFFVSSITLYRGLKIGADALLYSVFGFTYSCKHEPSCSVYTQDQIRLHGTIRGLIRGLRRLATCW